jgi:Holliday junction DNA helicase RuvB
MGKLEQPFIERFGLQFQLNYYDIDEMAQILLRTAQRLGMRVSYEVMDHISVRSRGTPRIANNFMKRIRDYVQVDGISDITPEFVDHIITEKLQTDDKGLRPLDYRYLRVLRNCPTSLGVRTIAAAISEEVSTVEEFIEPYLLSLGFIQRERTGRCLTEAGKKFIQTKSGMWE